RSRVRRGAGSRGSSCSDTRAAGRPPDRQARMPNFVLPQGIGGHRVAVAGRSGSHAAGHRVVPLPDLRARDGRKHEIDPTQSATRGGR
ncbi:MAG: hypothetical protein IJH84_24080, partial [Saccharopolyspora sp.]|uniref:hypothetical protein n=1 Tax=Saccharopolyspora sp. TaxID=33915 RepID=UPI0025D347DF